MDEARRFRFLIPPFFVALTVCAGLYFSGFNFAEALKPYEAEQLLAIGAVVGASVLPVGFLLTSVSILALSLLARICGVRTYEAVLPDETWKQISARLDTDLALDPKWTLYGSATFDHEMIGSGVHEWIQRRWTTFNLSVHSLTAVFLSHLAALSEPIHETCGWVLFSLALGIVFGVTAFIAWRQTMKMLAFQASRKPRKQEAEG